MNSSAAGSPLARPSVWGMADSNESRRSPACTRKRFGEAATNSTTNCGIGRPSMSDGPEAGVRASKKRSDIDRRPAAMRRTRNGWQSVFGGEVGTVAAAGVVEEVGSPRLSDDNRSIAARPEVRSTQSPQSAAHGQEACRARSAVPAHQRATHRLPPQRRPANQRRYEEKGTRRPVRKRWQNVVSGSGEGQRSRLPQRRARPGGTLWRLRSGTQRGACLRDDFQRHRRPGRRCHPRLVASEPAPLPAGETADDRGRLRRQQWSAFTAIQEAPARLRGRKQAGDHGLPLPAGNLEMESDRAPTLQPDHSHLGRPRTEYAAHSDGVHSPHYDHDRPESHRDPLGTNLPNGPEGVEGRVRSPSTDPPRHLPSMELYNPPTSYNHGV